MKHCITAIFIYMALSLLIFSSDANALEEKSYKVGVNDIIQIRVLDHSELDTLATVSLDGNITFPYIGTIHVKDMSPSEIEKEITRKLSEGYIKYPVVSVALMKSLSRNVYMYGEVYRRGPIPFEENMTVITALSLAAGITEEGLFGEIIIRRKQKGVNTYNDIEINLREIIEGTVKDVLLKPDDIIIVKRNREFFIHGEVANPGKKILEKGMTVLRALSMAGWLSTNGTQGSVKVRRKQKGDNAYEDIVIDMKRTIEGTIKGDVLLQPGDEVIVERNETFSIQGEVTTRGRFTLERDMNALKALLQAGGVTKDGAYGKIKIRRKEEGVPEGFKDIVESALNDGVIEDGKVEDTLLQPDDIIIVERNKTILIQGEVMSRGRVALEKDMTVLRALLQAGGITREAAYGKIKVRRKEEGTSGGFKDIVESALNDGVIKDSKVEDTLLQPDDIIVVERNKTFLIYGEVNKVGEYLLQNDMKVLKAITLAGGFTKWGSETGVKILRPKEDGSGVDTIKVNIKDIIDGDTVKDIDVKEGDTIVVTAGFF